MSRPDYSPTPVVMAINEIAFHGNIIPLTWFHHIQYENGKPNLVAIIILSDVIYWYRPQEQRDEETGKFVGWRSKFKGDMLQRSYDQLSDRLGITKRQAKEATDYLVSEKLLKREFRNVLTDRGNLLPNRMFLEPIPEGIKRINEMPTGGSEVSSIITEDTMVRQSGGYHGTPEWNTCTENTNSTKTTLSTKTSKNGINHPSMSAEPKKDEPEQTGMDAWMGDCYQNPNFLFLRACGVMNDGVAQELMVLPLSTLEYHWAIVKDSTKIKDKPGMLVSNLRKILLLEAAKQRAAAERAANPAAATPAPSNAHPDAQRYQRPDFITEAEWYGLRDMAEMYAYLDGAIFDGANGIVCRNDRMTSDLYMKLGGAVLHTRLSAILNWQPQEDWA